METNREPHESSTPTPGLPLEYASPRSRSDRATPRPGFGGRFAIGFFGYVAFSVAWFWGGATSGIGVRTLIGGWVVATFILLALSLYLRLRYGYSGVGYGILNALLLAGGIVGGILLLVIGICSGTIKF